MTTPTDTATRLAAAMREGYLTTDDRDRLASDDGWEVDGYVAWYRDTDDRIVVWEGNETDPDMNRLVEVTVA